MSGLLRLASFALLAVSIGPAIGAPSSDSEGGDPCSKVAGKTYVVPSDALACYKSFTFNETIRTNTLDNADRVLDFFTFESYYKRSAPPFQSRLWTSGESWQASERPGLRFVPRRSVRLVCVLICALDRLRLPKSIV